MNKTNLFPDYIFESSWEVCNKVGGIYTVLSTRAKTLQEVMGDNVVFIGPDCWGDNGSPYFIEDENLLSSWKETALAEGLKVKTGRWDIPGKPVAILVDFQPFFTHKEALYTELWPDFKGASLHAYGDSDEYTMVMSG